MKIAQTYGYGLKRIHGIEYIILSYRRPSVLKKSNSHEHVMKIYNTTISLDKYEDIRIKTIILIKNLGIAENKYNDKSIANLFINRKEAQYYQIQYGGEILPIINDKYDEKGNVKEKRKYMF